MFDQLGAQTRQVDAEHVRAWLVELAGAECPDDGRSRLELITALEELKGAAEGLQADLAVEVDASMRERAAERGVPAARQGQGVAHEIALARHVSPHRASSCSGWARCCATS
jgi:hypothetical protein